MLTDHHAFIVPGDVFGPRNILTCLFTYLWVVLTRFSSFYFIIIYKYFSLSRATEVHASISLFYVIVCFCILYFIFFLGSPLYYNVEVEPPWIWNYLSSSLSPHRHHHHHNLLFGKKKSLTNVKYKLRIYISLYSILVL